MPSTGQRLDALIKAADLTRRQMAERIGSSRATIDNCINDNHPPRNREQYRLLVEALGEDPFVPHVALDDAPSVPLNELPTDQVLDLLAHLLRTPDFASALADRLSRPATTPFGIVGNLAVDPPDDIPTSQEDAAEHGQAAEA